MVRAVQNAKDFESAVKEVARQREGASDPRWEALAAGELRSEEQGALRDLDPDLYEATRACWRASERRVAGAERVLAVADGIVRGVFIDLVWGPCQRIAKKDAGRLEFTGRVDVKRAKWVGRSVDHLFSRGSQNPLKYWRC